MKSKMNLVELSKAELDEQAMGQVVGGVGVCSCGCICPTCGVQHLDQPSPRDWWKDLGNGQEFVSNWAIYA